MKKKTSSGPSRTTIPVGRGSYTTALPAGVRLPCDTDHRPVTPVKAAGLSGPTPTNSWWTSLIWKRSNPYSESLFPHPLAMRAQGSGLGLSYPTEPTFWPDGRHYHFLYHEDLLVGVEGLQAEQTKVEAFSDWAVTARWEDGSRSLSATIGHGLPFVYMTLSGGSALVSCAQSPTIWHQEGGVIGLTIGGHHYGLFAPSGAAWSGSGDTLRSTLGGKDYLSVALLPDSRPETLALFRRYAYAFVSETRVSWRYDQQAGQLFSTYEVTTSPREGSEQGTLLALYRHQWLNTSAELTDYRYHSSRGEMRLLAGSAFTTTLPFTGVLPYLPDRGGYDRERLLGYLDSFKSERPLFLHAPEGTLDTYWVGKGMGRICQLLPIADQLGRTDLRDEMLGVVRGTLEDWLQAPEGKEHNLFYYNQTWGTLVGFPSNYGSDGELNDHHFHWSYYIFAAATLARYDREWNAREQWGGMVKLLIDDVANIDTALEPRFPRMRNYDLYAGHGWASGSGSFPNGQYGNNQESSSESINFSTALILWGTETGDQTTRDLGIFLYVNEVAAIQQYWFDIERAVFPSGYDHTVASIVWSSGGSYNTWWTTGLEEIHGINVLPVTGGSFYLGHHPEYIKRYYEELVSRRGGEPIAWSDILWSFYALYDAEGALERFDANPDYRPEEGESRAHTYFWINLLRSLGQVDPSVRADVPTYAVFKTESRRVHMAYNAEASPITVRFSDGATLAVAPRSLAWD